MLRTHDEFANEVKCENMPLHQHSMSTNAGERNIHDVKGREKGVYPAVADGVHALELLVVGGGLPPAL